MCLCARVRKQINFRLRPRTNRLANTRQYACLITNLVYSQPRRAACLKRNFKVTPGASLYLSHTSVSVSDESMRHYLCMDLILMLAVAEWARLVHVCACVCDCASDRFESVSVYAESMSHIYIYSYIG